MTNYKNNSIDLGYSDIASLVLRGCDHITELKLGEDGRYSAYVIDDTMDVPSHYILVDTFTDWLMIYDDDRKTAEFKGRGIEVYRSGLRGILIKIIK